MRSLYRFLIWLHPTEFRERFGDEMLCIFDEACTSSGAVCFIADAGLSLIRQRANRTQVWKWAAATLGGLISLVGGFGSFLPWQEMWAALRSAF